MAEQRVDRRLAAVLAADVVGYSRLTAADEEGTMRRLRTLRAELIDPTIQTNRGRVFHTAGDSILIEFASVVNAVRCSLAVQRGIAARNGDFAADKQIQFRVGIHLGDVMVQPDGDLMGDGINIAARLEEIAECGGICLSNAAYEQVRDKVNEQFTDLGDKELKNMDRPVRVYRVELGDGSATRPTGPTLALPDKPSIAVLPFQNMSGDLEQDYFCDGMVEEIITGLSRIRWLFVIARNSSFAYKGKSPDIRTVGRELGVRYVLEGSVRKAGGRVRITGQLIDAANGVHLWADRFEGGLENVFELQDRITESVVGAIEPTMRRAEMRRAQAKPTSSLDAYDCYLRALAAYNLVTREGTEEALALCRRAIELDQRYASAYAMASRCAMTIAAQGWGPADDAAKENVMAYGMRAIEYGGDDPTALWMAGHAITGFSGDLRTALSAIGRALALNPNCAQAWCASGWVRRYAGEAKEAIDDFKRAMRLSPLDPWGYEFKAGLAWAYFIEGQYAEAIEWADQALGQQPRFMPAVRVKLIACGLLGRTKEAENTRNALLALDPAATVNKLLTITPLSRTGPAEALAAYVDGLRKAGLPE